MSVHPIRPEREPLSWAQSLKGASTVEDVVSIARDFLATLSPEEIARLPRKLRPRRPVDAMDITNYAFDLFRAECQEPDEHHPIKRLGHFFADASVRISEILAEMKRNPEFANELRSD